MRRSVRIAHSLLQFFGTRPPMILDRTRLLLVLYHGIFPAVTGILRLLVRKCERILALIYSRSSEIIQAVFCTLAYQVFWIRIDGESGGVWLLYSLVRLETNLRYSERCKNGRRSRDTALTYQNFRIANFIFTGSVKANL